MPRVVVLDNLSQDGLDLLESSGLIDYEVRTGLKGEDLRQTLLEYDGAICRSGVKLTGDVLEGNSRLKVIVRAGAGTDNIDKDMATRQGMVVMNTPGGNAVSTAELALTLMLAMSRNVHPAYQSLIEGRWDRKQYMGTQLMGKTVGVIGLGRVGQALAERAQAMGMRVHGYDPFLSAQRARELGITTFPTVKEMLPDIDYLTVHTPLNDETRNLIGANEIQLMKKGARLVNCARGGIYNTEALAEGLRSGHLGGVAIDVYESEPCTENPLFGMPNVLCTPHLGASTKEAQTGVAVEAARLLIDFFSTGSIRSSVNVSPLDSATLERLSGLLNLAHRLGLLMAQVCESPPTRCTLRYQGEVAQKDCSLLSAAFAAGLLERAMDVEVSIINAQFLMRDRGIELVEQKSSDTGAFRSLITAEIHNNGCTETASATILGDSIAGLVQMGDSQLECRLEGTLLMPRHNDTPGVIGKIGEVCGNHGVNIAYLSVGRRPGEPTGTQLGMLMLDNEPPAEAIEELLALEPIQHTAIVHLPAANELPPWMRGTGE